MGARKAERIGLVASMMPWVLACCLGAVMASEQADGPWVAVASVVVAALGMWTELRSGRGELDGLRGEVAVLRERVMDVQCELARIGARIGDAESDS